MTILCTHPGRYGDLLWAMPTARALAEQADTPVDLVICQEFGSLAPLLRQQPYLGRVTVAEDWILRESSPSEPRIPPTLPTGYDRVVHLGYEGWPQAPLPLDVAQRAGVEIDLDRPWIGQRAPIPDRPVAVGFTDEYFELKVGLLWLLRLRLVSEDFVNLSTSPRWQAEACAVGCSWEQAAAYLARAPLFVGCCSALHVLACAVGTPVLLVDPQKARYHPVFYPYGWTGQVQMLIGNDGQPTFDARHLHDAIAAKLGRQP